MQSELKDTNFLHNLDRVTLDIMKAVSSAQNSGTSSIGDLVSVPHSKFMVVLSRAISLPELKRLRNHFVKMAKLRPPSQADPESIGNSFVDFINTST